VVHIVFDFTEGVADGLVGPAFDGTPEIDADQLAEDAGIGPFGGRR
jgi:hypothetical protein